MAGILAEEIGRSFCGLGNIFECLSQHQDPPFLSAAEGNVGQDGKQRWTTAATALKMTLCFATLQMLHKLNLSSTASQLALTMPFPQKLIAISSTELDRRMKQLSSAAKMCANHLQRQKSCFGTSQRIQKNETKPAFICHL